MSEEFLLVEFSTDGETWTDTIRRTSEGLTAPDGSLMSETPVYIRESDEGMLTLVDATDGTDEPEDTTEPTAPAPTDTCNGFTSTDSECQLAYNWGRDDPVETNPGRCKYHKDQAVPDTETSDGTSDSDSDSDSGDSDSDSGSGSVTDPDYTVGPGPHTVRITQPNDALTKYILDTDGTVEPVDTESQDLLSKGRVEGIVGAGADVVDVTGATHYRLEIIDGPITLELDGQTWTVNAETTVGVQDSTSDPDGSA